MGTHIVSRCHHVWEHTMRLRTRLHVMPCKCRLPFSLAGGAGLATCEAYVCSVGKHARGGVICQEMLDSDPRENCECILEKLTSFSPKASSLSSTKSSLSRQSRTTCLEEAEDVDGSPEEQAVAHASKTLTDTGPMRLDFIILRMIHKRFQGCTRAFFEHHFRIDHDDMVSIGRPGWPKAQRSFVPLYIYLYIDIHIHCSIVQVSSSSRRRQRGVG